MRLYLTPIDDDGEILVYKGDFMYSRTQVTAGKMHTLKIEEPDSFKEVESGALQGRMFSSNVWRVVMGRGVAAVYNGIDTLGGSVRPPEPSEKPRVRWLAYGSSITHGAQAISVHTAYVHQAALLLGVDVMNVGLSGACLCEPVVAEHLATRGDWDFITLELGINMRARMNSEEFEKYAGGLINTVATKNPDKQVYTISIFTNGSEFYENKENVTHIRNMDFIRIVKEQSAKYKNVRYIDGREVLSDPTGLACDLVHPSDYGHILMGHNLARIIGSQT